MKKKLNSPEDWKNPAVIEKEDNFWKDEVMELVIKLVK